MRLCRTKSSVMDIVATETWHRVARGAGRQLGICVRWSEGNNRISSAMPRATGRVASSPASSELRVHMQGHWLRTDEPKIIRQAHVSSGSW
jgi:hypothetical protein